MPNILVVEDDPKLAGLVKQLLEGSGYAVTVESRGDRAVGEIVTTQPELVILDVNLPGLDGFAVCRDVRPRYPGRVLMLTARGEEMDEVVGLEAGADDYLAKPVSPQRLLARVRALLRRPTKYDEAEEDDGRYRTGDLVIDRERRSVEMGGVPLRVSSTEFDILTVLARHVGEPVSRADLCREVRGTEYDGLDRSIDIQVSRLRGILGDEAKDPHWIKTVRGVGYLLAKYS